MCQFCEPTKIWLRPFMVHAWMLGERHTGPCSQIASSLVKQYLVECSMFTVFSISERRKFRYRFISNITISFFMSAVMCCRQTPCICVFHSRTVDTSRIITKDNQCQRQFPIFSMNSRLIFGILEFWNLEFGIWYWNLEFGI